MDTPNGRKEIEEMFGNPANDDGTLNEAWEGANIRKIAPPDGWQLYYKDDDESLVRVSGVRMHKLLEDVFQAGPRTRIYVSSEKAASATFPRARA